MFDLLLLFSCLFMISAILRKKSIVLKVCNAVLFATFLFVVLFTTNNAYISNLVSKCVGKNEYEIIKNVLTDSKLFSYASYSVWLLYKVATIVFVTLYGLYAFTGYIVKTFVVVKNRIIRLKLFNKRENSTNLNNDYSIKKFLMFERLLN